MRFRLKVALQNEKYTWIRFRNNQHRFSHVLENEKDATQSSIVQIGTRIIQFDTFSKVDKSGKVSESKNPEQDFAAGK